MSKGARGTEKQGHEGKKTGWKNNEERKEKEKYI